MTAPIKLYLGTAEGESRISVRSFIDAVKASETILRELDSTLVEGKFEWYFAELGIGSGRATFTGTWADEDTEVVSLDSIESASRLIATRFVEGLSILENRPEWPPGFTLDALQAARRLVAIRENGVISIEASTPGTEPAVLSLQVDQHIQDILGHRYSVLGSVEGIMETISVRKAPYFRIRERSSGHSIKCSFSKGRLPEVKVALGRPILASGLLSYAEHGELLALTSVDSIVLLDETETTQIDQILGIAHDFTDGMTVDEFIDWIHDDVEP